MDQIVDRPDTKSVAETLRDARLSQGLELGQIAETTHVRREYLEAIEEGRFEELPEPIYARNFLKLFAKAVGLDGVAMVERYQQEVGNAPPVNATKGTNRGASSTYTGKQNEPPVFQETRRFTLSAWLPTFLLIAVVVGAALWLFNQFLFNPTENVRVAGNALADVDTVLPGTDSILPNPANDAATEAPLATESPITGEAAVPTGTVLFSLTTEPPGAEVSIDSYVLPGTTPIQNAPISAGSNRTLQITLDGYEPLIENIDLVEDLQLNLDLAIPQATEIIADDAATTAEAGAAPATDTAAADTADTIESNEATAGTVPVAGGDGILVVTVNDDTWVEVYNSEARGDGERLVYQTLESGESRAFELPVYIHVGNAGGVDLNLNGQDIGTLGSSGEVLGRAFAE